jgi:hypothetical protein
LKARTPEAASVAAQARLKSRPAVVGTVGATVSPPELKDVSGSRAPKVVRKPAPALAAAK